MLKYLTLFLFLAAFLVSCKSSNPVSPGSSFTQPKAGSSFTFDEYSTDTTTGLPIPGTRDTSVQTFVQTGMSYKGKINVSEVVSVTSSSRDTFYLNFESNGDISEYEPGLSANFNWFTIPIGSKTTSLLISEDTTISFGGITEHTKSTVTISYVDDETMTVKGQSLSVTKLQLLAVSTQTVTPPGTTTTTTDISFAYFAPSLGYLTKSETPVSTDPTSGTKSQGRLSILFDYTEK